MSFIMKFSHVLKWGFYYHLGCRERPAWECSGARGGTDLLPCCPRDAHSSMGFLHFWGSQLWRQNIWSVEWLPTQSPISKTMWGYMWDRIIGNKIRVKTGISNGAVTGIIYLRDSESRKLNSTSILSKQFHLSVFFILKL
jgi:hypothetical protein